MRKITVPLLVASTLLHAPSVWSQTTGGNVALPAPGGSVGGGGITTGGGTTFGGVGSAAGNLGGTTITGNGTTSGSTAGNAGGTSATGIGLAPVVAPPVENLVPGSEGNIVFPPVENLVPGSENQIVFPPAESLTPAPGLTPDINNNLGTPLGTGAGTGTGTTGVATGGVFYFGMGLRGPGRAITPGPLGTTGIPGQLQGGQGGYRGDGYTPETAGGQVSTGGGGTGGERAYITESPGSIPGSPEAITAPVEPFDGDEPDTLDFSISS